MNDHQLHINDEFESEILENRRRIIEKFEEIAGRASKFRNDQTNGSSGTIPLVVVGVVDAVRMVREASGDGVIELSQDEFRQVLERSGRQLLFKQTHNAGISSQYSRIISLY